MFKYLSRTVMVIASFWVSGHVQVLAQAIQLPSTQAFDGEVLRDPTRPFSTPASSQLLPDSGIVSPGTSLTRSNYNVTFIRDGDTSPMAVINDQRVTVGDLIDGATVMAISPTGVTLSVNGLEQEINTFGPTVKEVSGTEF